MSEISDRNLVLKGLVPEGRRVLATQGADAVTAVLTGGVLYCVTDQLHRAELRVSPVRSGQGHVLVSVTHCEEEDGHKVTSAWSFDLGQGEPLAFTTEYTLGDSVRSPRPDAMQNDECFAHELAKALGCPLKFPSHLPQHRV
jgi:hypothetical protein